MDFEKEIAPIFQKSCIECHGPKKDRGDLRLDTRDAAFKSAIVAGKADESEVVKRIILPKDHDDIMPPKGGPLPSEQIEAIRNWINEGALWPEGFVINADEGGSKEAKAPEKLPDFKPAPAELKAVAQLESLGVSIRPIAQNIQWKEASFRSLGTNATDSTIAPLKDVLGLLELNLAGTKITDAGLASIKGLTNLVKLHLEHTEISDAGLAHLKELKNLRYLNVFNTKVSDAGLKHLENLPNLENVYVWQSKVTDAGARALQSKLPGVKVHLGVELSAAPKEEKKK